MKRSNFLLILLSVVLLAGLFITDHVLVIQYAKVNLNDRYKNFELIPVQPFKKLKISGGNGYAVRIMQANDCNIRLMNSRKAFFKMEKLHDTLSVTFSVANQNYQRPEASVTGLIISAPHIDFLQLSGTNNEIGPFTQDSLKIVQEKNTYIRVKQLQLDYLALEGSGISYFDFELKNTVQCLSLNIKNSTTVNFQQLSFEKIHPVLRDSAAIILNNRSLAELGNSQLLFKDSILRNN